MGIVSHEQAGKSSLLNSLLDSKGLARTVGSKALLNYSANSSQSNSGEACTCVPTEYRFHPNDGYDIEVSLFSEDELQHQLAEMIQPYRKYHLHLNEMDPAERSAFEEKANLARDTFRAMFRDRLGNETFLVDKSEEAVLKRLFQWARDLRPSEFQSRHSGLTLQDCSTLLMELSSEPPSKEQPAVWPYIRHVK